MFVILIFDQQIPHTKNKEEEKKKRKRIYEIFVQNTMPRTLFYYNKIWVFPHKSINILLNITPLF